MFSKAHFTLKNLLRLTSIPVSTLEFSNLALYTKKLRIPLIATAFYAYMPANIKMDESEKKQEAIVQKQKQNSLQSSKLSIWSRLWKIIIHVIRFFHLLIIFTPSILLSPLLFLNRTQDFWMDLFVKAIERSGVVFIKAFQYLSHRRDIIGPQLASKFEYLRQKAPIHSFEVTEKYFKDSYGKKIGQIFEEFDRQPIASGSVSQVYKAMYKGKKVAVKVRHPNVDRYIERDINVLFFLSFLASYISPAYEIPVSYTSLKKTLIQQIDFTFQMKNLNTFNQMFKERRDVRFPQPFQQNTKDMVLIEQFVQGMPVSYYQKCKHPLNKIIARQGTGIFFEMLMKNNFIHADCHAGNIFIEMKQQSFNFFTEIRDMFKDVMYVLQCRLKAQTVDASLRQLYLQYCQQQIQMRKIRRKQKESIMFNMLDAGMVIRLEEKDKKVFVKFIKAVIQSRGEECAEMIYNLSKYEGHKLTGNNFSNYKKDLQKVFGSLNGRPYSELKGMTLFHDMLSTIRKNKMKLDGQFATLLTNIIVLEGIGRNIDPDINILKCAFPYFKYVDDDDRKIEIM